MKTKEEIYLEYLLKHKSLVEKSFIFIKDVIPEYFELLSTEEMLRLEENIKNHDNSKFEKETLIGYAEHFTRENINDISEEYKKALMNHYHVSPHHPQYWLAIYNMEKIMPVEMDLIYILEMISDWLSFSFLKNDMHDLKHWFDRSLQKFKFATRTKQIVEDIVNKIDIYMTKNY